MEILKVRDAIVETLGALSVVAEAWGAAHAQNLKSVLWHAKRFPSVAVAVLSDPEIKDVAGEVVITVRFGAFCGAKGVPAKGGNPGIKRHDGALIVKTAVAKAVALATDWGTGLAKKPKKVSAQNLSNLEVDKNDVALWVVTWDQDVTLDSSVDLDALPPLLLIQPGYDLDDDGTIQAVDDVEIPQ